MSRAALGLCFVGVLAGAGCGSGDGTVEPAGLTTIGHDFPAFHVEAGEEIRWQCQSWKVGNPEALFVRGVRARSGGAFHHSNWFVTTEITFPGGDGTWPCDERGFEEIATGISGTVLFAQSTQATADDQIFPPGTALRLRSRAHVVGDVHLVNVGDTALDTNIRIELDTVPESEVHTELHPSALTYNTLDIAARRQSEFTTSCDLDAAAREVTGDPLEARLYYLLPHYHEWGTSFRVEILGGPRDGEVIFEVGAAEGDALGRTFDPPIDLTGATGLRYTCAYDNPLDRNLRFGLADGEMCMLLMYTDAPLKFVGQVDTSTPAGEHDGVLQHDGSCQVFAFRD